MRTRAILPCLLPLLMLFGCEEAANSSGGGGGGDSSDLTAQIEALQASLEEQGAQLEAITAQVEAHGLQLASQETSLSSTVANTQVNTANIASNAADLASITSDVLANTSAVQGLSSSVDQLTLDLEANEDTIEDNADAIYSLQGLPDRVMVQGQRINVLESSSLTAVDLTAEFLWSNASMSRDLSGAVFDGLDLSYSYFWGHRMDGASFVGADLTAVSLHGDLQGADFTDAILAGTVFAGDGPDLDAPPLASLQGAIFDNAALDGVVFMAGNYQEASFAGATFSSPPTFRNGVDFTDADFTDATIPSGTVWDYVTCPDGVEVSGSDTCCTHLDIDLDGDGTPDTVTPASCD